MCTNVTRWGNSLAIRLPKNIAAELDLRAESEVSLHVENGRIVITPSRPKYDLKSLVADNLHGETEWGPAAGKEVL